MAIAPISETIGGWLFVGLLALALFVAVSTGSTLNMVRGFGPVFVDRADRPKLYWFSVAFLAVFLVFVTGGMIAMQFRLLPLG